MIANLTRSSSVLDIIGVLSSFSVTETIWATYEKFAVKKLEDGTLAIKGYIYSVDGLSLKGALNDFELLNKLIPILSKQIDLIRPIDDKEFARFRKAAIDFYDTINLLFEKTDEVIHKHSYNKATIKAMEKSGKDNVKKFKNSAELFSNLGI